MKSKKFDMKSQKLKYKNIIIAVSILIPIVVAILLELRLMSLIVLTFFPEFMLQLMV